MSTTIKPSRSTNTFWPATRARNFVKKLDPSVGRWTFDTNIRYLAAKYGVTPEEFLLVNPMEFSKKMGWTAEEELSVIRGAPKRMREEEPEEEPVAEEKKPDDYDISDWRCMIV